MLLGILSDIHSHLRGLTTALKVLKGNKAERIICLGDIVGYGEDPVGTLEMTATYCDSFVKGNHDVAVSTDCNLTFYSESAKKEIYFQRKKMGDRAKKWINNLPYSFSENQLTFTHASVPDPEQWFYPSRNKSNENSIIFVKPKKIFHHLATKFLFVGHSHEPGITFLTNDNVVKFTENIPDDWIVLDNSKKVIIDVGSVSIPRNNDYSTCLLFNTDNLAFKFIKFQL